MKKTLKVLALMALMAVPWAASAQSGCTIRVEGEDSYGDGWNGGSLTIAQGGTTLNTFSLSGTSDNISITLTTSDPVTFTWSSGSYDSEVTIRIYDGGNTLAYSVTQPSAGLIYTMSSPCPSCLPPTNITATNITTDGMTVSWSDASNSGNYTLSYWKTGGDTTTVSLTDTTYTLTSLDANSPYNFAVVTICSATDESSPLTGIFVTACGGSTCDMTLELGSTSTYSNPFTYYSGPASVELFQNGFSLGAYSSTSTVEVCGTDTIVVKYNHSGYSWGDYYDNYASITIRDGGGVAVYSGSWGDTLCVVGTPCPTCIPPVLHVDSITSEEIYLSWTPRSGASQFIVYLGDSLVSDNVTDTFYAFTNLSSNTQYTMRVQSVCSVDDSSSIVNISARTECGTMTLPFYEDFNSYSYGAFPPCWHRVKQHGTDPSVNTEIYGLNGTMYMFCIASNDTNLFVSPSAVPLPGDQIHVSYDAFLSGSNAWIKAGVMTNYNDVSTFVALDSVGMHSFNNNFESRDFNTSTLDPTASYYIAWMYFSTSTSDRGAVDNISINVHTGCDRPTSAYATTNVTAHTADLGWTEVAGVSGYTVYYGTVNDPANSNNLTATTTDTTITLTGLNSETQYYAWVVSNCGSDESDVRPLGSFTTLVSCPAVTGLTVDTTTTDGATISWHSQGTETEWAVVIDSDNVVTVNDSSYTFSNLNPMTGHTVYVRPICDADDTGAARSITFATRCADPTCNMTVNGTDSYGDGWNGNAINFYQAGTQIGSVTINSGNSVTENIEVCSTSPVEIRFTLGSYATEMGGTITDGGGNVVFTISNMNSHSTGDILATVANPCPNCVPPTGLTLDTVTATEATIHWVAQDGQSSWIVRIDSNDYNVTDTFYTFTGLNPVTSYTVSVATDCTGDTSNWLTTSFVTGCGNGECDITVVMADSYGDGWNGNAVYVYQNGAHVGSATIAGSSNSGTETVSVCANMPVEFRFHAGSYPGEISFTIYDGGDEAIYTAAQGSMNGVADGTVLDSVANACPTCLKPANVIATYIDSNDLAFSWTVNPQVIEYLVSFDGGIWQSNTIGTYSATGLNPNTAYTFSVKARCDVYDTSNARTITVKTSCGQMVLPYVESFEADAQGNVPSCWTVVRPGYEGYPGVSGSEHTGSNGMTLAANYNDSTTIATSAVPLAGDSIYVSFWASVNAGNTLQAGVMTDLAYDSTFIPLMSIPSNGSTYTLYEFNTSSLGTIYSNTTFYVAFRLVTGSSNHYADIDDINIRLDEGCMYPANLTANPSATNVDLEWSANGVSMGTYVVQYKTNGATTWDSAGTTPDTTFTILGLSAATAYNARVGLVCGNDTLWTNVSFTTSCAILPLPYFEDFEAYANDVMPPCWGWNTSFCTHWDGGVFFRSYQGGGTNYAVLPELDGNINKYQVEFDCKVGTPAEQDGILLGVADAAGVLVGWLDTIQDPNHSRNAHVHHVINMVNYSLPYGAARIAFAQYRNWGEWALIDNINIIELPDCLPVDTLAVHNIEDPDHTSFTWSSMGEEAQWQVYVDTVTANIDSVPDSLFTTVTTRNYTIPIGDIQGGGIYTFYVRADCGVDQSSWSSYTFGAGTVIMNNSSVADTVIGCGLVVYDNGGPIAGYLPNSNSALVIRSENAGSELEVFGGAFGFGSSAATLNIYDGEGTDGSLLYTYSIIDGRDTIDSVLATSTTGALTITFTASGNMCHTGYELYIHCVGTAICERPTQLQAEMTFLDEADVTWHGTSAAYELYYKPSGASVWNVENCTTASAHLTGLIPDTNYDLYVVGICGSETSTPSFPIVLNTHFDVVIEPCDPATDLAYSDVSTTSAVLNWTSDGSAWEIEVKHLNVTDTINVTAKPYTLTDLMPTMQYNVRVRTVCDNIFVEPYSEWSNTVTFTTQTPNQESIDNAENSMMAIYPNPANSVVTISVAMEGHVEMNLVDMNGRVVYTHAIKQSDNKTISVDVSKLAKGAYFVRIVGEQATAVRKLIVK